MKSESAVGNFPKGLEEAKREEMRWFKQFSEALLATLFPVSCKVCGRLVETSSNGVACQDCWDRFIPLSPTECCRRCGYPSNPASPYALSNRSECAQCDNLTFSYARSCGSYDGALQASIVQLKTRPLLSKKLIDLLVATFERDEILKSSDAIIPVPLHSDRLRERGFNQAEIIAEQLSRRVGIPLDLDSLARVKSTAKHRAGMDLIDRNQSVAGAFRVTRPRMIADRTVLLIDDVFTTGSTLSACARTLLNAGASRVNLLTIARVVNHKDTKTQRT